jgi:hypothetical protein
MFPLSLLIAKPLLMKNIYILLILFSILISFNSCKKEDDNSPGSGINNTGDQITTNISGTVRDLQGNVVAGAQVTAGGQTVSTNGSGVYLLQNVSVNKKRAVVSAVKAGYWLQQKGIIAHANTTCYADIVLFTDDKSYSVNAVTGGTVTMPGGSIITFPANAFVTSGGTPFNGTVTITAHEILTADDKYFLRIPGGDFQAKDANGEMKFLFSMGMAGAKLYDGTGNELKIAAGKTAFVKFPVNPAQASVATPTIQLWHYDENEMLWIEEGAATLNGNYYEANVSHFSWFNCDYTGATCTMNLTLVDCSGQPVPNQIFDFDVMNGYGHSSGMTDANGTASGLVPANLIMTVTLYNSNWNQHAVIDTVGPFTPNSSVNLTIQVGANCDYISGSLFDCFNNSINGNVSLLFNNQPVAWTTTTNGNFSFNIYQSGTYQLVANSGQLTGSTTFTYLTGTPIINMMLALCDTISTGANNFNLTFTSAATGSFNYAVNVTQAAFIISNGLKSVVFTYEDSISGTVTTLVIGTPGYAPATYAWNSVDSYVSGNVMYMGQPASLTSGTGQTVFTNTPPIGSNIQGSFNGQVIMDAGNGITIPGTLTATFDVMRTQ